MRKRAARTEKQFRSITRLIAEELKNGIVAGRLAPGERFSEEKLAATLKVSRVPLREALHRLETEGYITFVGGDAIAVNKPTADEIEDHYLIAGALEGLAARLAVERAGAEEISRLRELHLALKEAYRANDLEAYFAANGRFHEFIAEIARNEKLRRLIGQTRQEMQKTRILSLRLPQRLDYSMREHDQILDAFLKKNGELAERTAATHLHNQMEALRRMLEVGEG